MALPRTPEPEVMDSPEEAVGYDSMDHAEVNRRFVEDYLELVGRCRNQQPQVSAQNRPGSRVLDLGTGTAQIPILLSQRLTQSHVILAVDLSWEMLLLAGRNIQAAGCEGSVLPMYCNARQLPIADQSCHQLMSNSIIHHIPDPTFVLSEVRRVAAPGAVIFLRDLLRPSSKQEVEDLVTQWAGSADPHQQQMFRESLHAAFTVPEMQKMLQAVGLNPQWVRQTTDRHWTVAGQMPDGMPHRVS